MNQRINESTNQRINESINEHSSVHTHRKIPSHLHAFSPPRTISALSSRPFPRTSHQTPIPKRKRTAPTPLQRSRAPAASFPSPEAPSAARRWAVWFPSAWIRRDLADTSPATWLRLASRPVQSRRWSGSEYSSRECTTHKKNSENARIWTEICRSLPSRRFSSTARQWKGERTRGSSTS